MDKQRIERNFAGAAADYDRHATIQRQAAARLAGLIALAFPRVARILEIGCGTGNLTRDLLRAYPEATLCATDLASSMLLVCAAHTPPSELARMTFRHADGEDLPSHGHDLVASSLAFQWFDDPLGALRRLHAQGGSLGVATLVEGTFSEWKAAHAELGLVDGIRHFVSESELRALAQDLGGQLVFETIREHHPHAVDFVRSIKGVGAATPRPGHQPARLRQVLRRFPQGISASYRVAYLLISDRGAPSSPS